MLPEEKKNKIKGQRNNHHLNGNITSLTTILHHDDVTSFLRQRLTSSGQQGYCRKHQVVELKIIKTHWGWTTKLLILPYLLSGSQSLVVCSVHQLVQEDQEVLADLGHPRVHIQTWGWNNHHSGDSGTWYPSFSRREWLTAGRIRTFSPLGPWKLSPMFPWGQVAQHCRLKQLQYLGFNANKIRIISFKAKQDLLNCFSSPLVQEGQVDLEDPGRRQQKNYALVNCTS